MARSTMRSAMAVVSFTSEPTGVLTEICTMPWSMAGMSTILVDMQAAMKMATRAAEASIPTHRWLTK